MENYFIKPETLHTTDLLWMLDFETQQEVLKNSITNKNNGNSNSPGNESSKATKINQNLNNNSTQTVNIVNNLQNRNRTTSLQRQRQNYNRNANAPNLYQFTSICANCGQHWTYHYCQTCQAKRRNWNNCGTLKHFAKKCKNLKILNPKNHHPKH